MCLTPKLLFIKASSDSRQLSFIVPCGKCKECCDVKRSEFVFRCKAERDVSACCYFVTLTYSDNNLHFRSFDFRKTGQQELKRISLLSPREPFKYQNFVLDKLDFSNFMSSMQKVIKRISPSLRFRMVVAGEYGTWSYRPHGHALIFSPVSFTIKQFEDIIKECWRFGNISVYNANDGAFNYLAKHFIKDDCGSKFQQEICPRFLKYSVYDGGIGSNLINNKSLVNNFINNINFVYNGKFKTSIPRFLRRKLHPFPFTYEELKEKGFKSLFNFFIRQYHEGRRSVFDFFEFSDGVFSISPSKFYEFSKKGRLINFKNVYDYKRQKFNKKVLSLQCKGYYSSSDNFLT